MNNSNADGWFIVQYLGVRPPHRFINKYLHSFWRCELPAGIDCVEDLINEMRYM